MFYLAKYNTQTTISFPLVKRGVVDLAVSADYTPAAADSSVSKDQGSTADTSNTVTAVTGGGTRSSALWKLTLTATELQAAEIVVQIIDAATKAIEDQVLIIYTYGNASAKIPFDFSDAVRAGLTGIPNATPGAAGGMFIAGTNAATTITSAGGDALTLSSTGTNGNGLVVSGNGSGNAIKATGGTTGHGIAAVGGATSGDGINSVATTSGHGITATGVGTTKHGLNAAGGSTSSHGISAAGGGTGDGIKAVGGLTGVGFEIVGGGTSGDGLKVTTTSGHGFNIAATGTSMHGITATGGNGGTSDGIKGAAGTGGVDIRGAITGNITGNLSGSVGSVTGAVGSVTGAVGSVTGNVGGNVVGSVASVTARVTANTDQWAGGTIPAPNVTGVPLVDLKYILGTVLTETAGLLAGGFKKFFNVAGPTLTTAGIDQTGDNYARLGAPAGASVSADIAAVKSDTGTINTNVAALPSANANADALLDRSAGVETGLTPRQWLRLAAAALFGKASGLDTAAPIYRDTNDTKNRITATTDANGNRTAVTLNSS